MKLKIGESYRLKHTPHCPVCNEKLDGATIIDHDGLHKPTPGDVTVCWRCTSFLTYTDAMQLRLLTEMEVYGLDAHAKAVMIEMRKRIKAYQNDKR